MANFFKRPALVTLGKGKDDKGATRAITGSVALTAVPTAGAAQSPNINIAGFITRGDVAEIDVASLNVPATFRIRTALLSIAYETDPTTAGKMLSTPVIVYNTTTGECVFLPYSYFAVTDDSGTNGSPMLTACFPFFGDINSRIQIIEPVSGSNADVEVQVAFMFLEEERQPYVVSGMSTYPFGTL